MKKIAITAIVVGLALGATACSAATPASTPSATKTSAALTGTIQVYGAASLTAAFTELAIDFEKANPGVTVTNTFNGSSTLVTQIQNGAPADVFASADTVNMEKLSTSGLVAGTPDVFATNTMEIVVPKGNPAKITDFADLAKSGVKTVVCAASVPCGAAALALEKLTGVTISPVSQELAVTGVLSKVSSGEADAGLVYVTDVKGALPAGQVEGVTFTESPQVVNTYPIVALKNSKNPRVAQALVDYITGKTGQALLKADGFGKP
ncbi:MAG: molybdate-binding protein [Microbacteriaceae bacterium]|nr:molybdate-binding protein [Microbacteriaceae bacterium]